MAGVVYGESGRVFYLLRPNGRAIAVIDVQTDKERGDIELELDPADRAVSISPHPDGKRLLLTTGNLRYNISIAEGFAQPETGWRRWFRHWRIPEPKPVAANEAQPE